MESIREFFSSLIFTDVAGWRLAGWMRPFSLPYRKPKIRRRFHGSIYRLHGYYMDFYNIVGEQQTQHIAIA